MLTGLRNVSGQRNQSALDKTMALNREDLSQRHVQSGWRTRCAVNDLDASHKDLAHLHEV